MATNIVINPESDAAFKGLAETHLARGATTPAELERRLRPRYPTVRVIEGISSSASIERWYVYRDGRWVNSETGR